MTARARSRAALLGVAALLVPAALVTPVALFATEPAVAADVSPVNPVTVPVDGHPANQGFLVFVEGDVELAADEAEGTLAAGGDLAFETSYNIGAGNPPANALTLPGESRPTFLYVDGGIRFPAAQSAVLRVLNGGYAHVGDTATYDAFDTDQNGATIDYRLAPEGTTAETFPRVEGTTRQPASSVPTTADPSVLDFASSFARYRSLSADLGTCPVTTVLHDAAGAPLPTPIAPGTAAYADVQPGVTNVLTVDAEDLDALDLLTFDGLPGPGSPLVVNVTGTTFDGSVPNLANLTNAHAPFVLWNFPDATTVHVTGADVLEGTIYAPRADLRWDVTQNVEGNVVAASFTHGVAIAAGPVPREIHGFPFSTTVSCLSTDAVEGDLTLVKQVVGGDADPGDWTLTATGPTTVSGTSGSDAVTGRPVPPGDYTLTESGGPDGYEAGAWTCTGAPVTDGVVTVADGDDVVCTIVNTALPDDSNGGGDGGGNGNGGGGSDLPTPDPGGTGTGNQGGDGGPGTGGGVDTAPVAGVEPGGGTGSLAATGADPLPLALLALGLLVTGGTTALVRHRIRSVTQQERDPATSRRT
ncbi:choice-of-anchor A family protein [Curtobacterium flaccumfaciens pv. flaccumfaciens]|uniref:collagen-binding domain-containing protein n=1 Tax=Curtobacterium flaccumfaciens TaxID=2035 RepID=UPI001BDF2302|nr:collagen-binding domain-containing protein [Curtobacterium flaccumfaciens]MBT1669097.1 choice-of-anchor A family protein [Curtobacterium flaccumfaciens pv. flaccumfaciens]